VRLLATSPVPGAWTVHLCERCRYTWRSIEPASRTTREHYPERYRLSEEDIERAVEVPSIGELRA
jgi:hypothetical protein